MSLSASTPGPIRGAGVSPSVIHTQSYWMDWCVAFCDKKTPNLFNKGLGTVHHKLKCPFFFRKRMGTIYRCDNFGSWLPFLLNRIRPYSFVPHPFGWFTFIGYIIDLKERTSYHQNKYNICYTIYKEESVIFRKLNC